MIYVRKDKSIKRNMIVKAESFLCIFEETKTSEIIPKISDMLIKNWFNVGLKPMELIIIACALEIMPKIRVTLNRAIDVVRREEYLNKSIGFVPFLTVSTFLSFSKSSMTSSSLTKLSSP